MELMECLYMAELVFLPGIYITAGMCLAEVLIGVNESNSLRDLVVAALLSGASSGHPAIGDFLSPDRKLPLVGLGNEALQGSLCNC